MPGLGVFGCLGMDRSRGFNGLCGSSGSETAGHWVPPSCGIAQEGD